MPSKVFSKGDSMFELPQKTSMGGGGGPSEYSGRSSGYGSIPRPPPAPRAGADIDEVVFHNMNIRDNEAYRQKIRASLASKPKIDKPMGAAAIGMGAAAGAGIAAKKRKDAEKMEAYKRKPRMADKPPKINLRKAYQE